MQIVLCEKCPDVGTFARICWTGVCGTAWAGGSETVLKPRDCGRKWLSSALRCLRTACTLCFDARKSQLRLTLAHFKTASQGWFGQADWECAWAKVAAPCPMESVGRAAKLCQGGDDPAPPKVTTAATACRRPPVHLRPIRGRRPAVTKRIWRMRGALVRSLQRKSRERLLQPDGFARRDRQQRERPRQRPEAARFRGARHG